MLLTKIIVSSLLAFIPAAGFAAEPTWGAALNGLRIGMSLAPDTDEPRVKVSFQNTGTADVDALLGANGLPQVIEFRATSREGKGCDVLNLIGRAGAGVLLPYLLHVAPGEVREVTLPMARLVCVEKRTDIAMNKLLEQQYTVHAIFKSRREGAEWGKIEEPWLGEVSSGEFPATRKDASQNSRL